MDFSLSTPHIFFAAILLGVAFVLTLVCSIVLWVRAARLRRFARYEQERTYLDWIPEQPVQDAKGDDASDEDAEESQENVAENGEESIAEETETEAIEETVEEPVQASNITSEPLPSVSVVVYAHNDGETLERFLPLMLHQNYPDFEVIVVDDGSYDDSRNILSDMLPHFDNLRVTFSPDDTRALSRKKLALMIGIKAATKDVVITTNANCRIMSDQWLRLMMRNFVPGIDVVLGFSHYRYRKDKSIGRFYRVFDSVIVALEWIGSTINRRPYRGISDNLAFRRQVFFDHSGFSSNLDLRWGEDDVWVSEIVDRNNTRLELDSNSQVQTYWDDVPHAHHLLKLRRDFTSRFVSKRAFIQQALFSWCNYLRLAALIAAVAIDYTNLSTITAAAVLIILSWILVILPFNRCCRALGAPALSLSIPLFNLWRPIVNFYYRLRGISTRKSNYTSIYN